jgi:hypothetical protein
MVSVLRVLVAAALALVIALPGVGFQGPGTNSGGVGVWVLPFAAPLTPPGGEPRATRTGLSIAQDCVLELSPDCGPVVATFVDDMTGEPVALHVSGSLVRIPASLMQALVGLPQPTATIVIADSEQRGYVIEITVAAGGTASVRVY